MGKNFDEFSTQEAIKLAQSPAGQQLLANLQAGHAPEMQNAMHHLQQGDYAKAMQLLSDFLAEPSTQSLLRQLQEERHA